MDTQTKKLHEAVEILKEEFSFIADLKLYVENDITLAGGFNYMKCYNGFGEIIEHPIIELRFKFFNTEYFGGYDSTGYTTEQIGDSIRTQIKNGLSLMKEADEDRAVEFGEPVKYRYNYDKIINDLRK